jgi:hypothetical protein
MISQHLSFDLPAPWTNKKFETDQIGLINFLVGPNGSGKSRFIGALLPHLPKARLLGTDRLAGMEQKDHFASIWGDHFASGLQKSLFDRFRNIGLQGSGIDTIVLLEERLDLRIQLEATLSDLFNRKIILEWDSGNLLPRAVLGNTGTSYRLDRDECHGIKELLVLLTHLYNDQSPYLIIDEPELNLHPQYQAFFMQEVRKVIGDPSQDARKKIVFLVTHSPFILDFKCVEEMKSVMSFSLDHSIPKTLFHLDAAATSRLSTVLPRVNVHHKQLFFSDNPIFVEGILDAQLVAVMQETRGTSIAGAGSCIIDAGGCEEVNRYLELCGNLGKRAYFLYDLDSLFNGNLKACVKSDGSVQSFLAAAGVGNDFGKYCGELESKLTRLIDALISQTSVPAEIDPLLQYLKKLGGRAGWDSKAWAKARVAVMTAISRHPTAIENATSIADVRDVDGRMSQIIGALRQKNVFLLPGGTLERYLPSYAGDHYDLADDAKRNAVLAEIDEMGKGMDETQLAARYGDLYQAIRSMPGKRNVSVEPVLRAYLSQFIHDLQNTAVSNPDWDLVQIQARMSVIARFAGNLFSVRSFTRTSPREFEAIVDIGELVGEKPKHVRVSHRTNAGMGEFLIESH